MLSIRIDAEHEWWVSGSVFDRLYQAALDRGTLPGELDHWRHVAAANGGLDLDLLPARDADDLARGLRAAATAELAALSSVEPGSADATYRAALEKLTSMSLDER